MLRHRGDLWRLHPRHQLLNRSGGPGRAIRLGPFVVSDEPEAVMMIESSALRRVERLHEEGEARCRDRRDRFARSVRPASR